MRDLINYTCKECGGALVVDRNQKIYECPFCGTAFDFATIHRKELLNDAGKDLKNMEFFAAKQKYKSLLESDPQDFDALKGLVFSSGGVQSEKTFYSMDSLKSRRINDMTITLQSVLEQCKKEDARYFKQLMKLIDTADAHNNAVTSANASTEDTSLIDLLFGGCFGHIVFMMLMVLLTGIPIVFYTSQWVAGLIYTGFVALVYTVCILVRHKQIKQEQEDFKYYKTEEYNDHKQKNRIIRDIEKQYEEEVIKLQNLSSNEKDDAPVSFNKDKLKPSVPAGNTNGSEAVICTQCGGRLSADVGNQIYRCDHCGVAFGNSILFDKQAINKAQLSAMTAEYSNADLWYRSALMTEPGNFEALRGRILCAGKWENIRDAIRELPLTKFKTDSILNRAEYAIRNASCEEDIEYFKRFRNICTLNETMLTLRVRQNSLRESIIREIDELSEEDFKEKYLLNVT